MNTLNGPGGRGRSTKALWLSPLAAAGSLLALAFLLAPRVFAQVVPAADRGGLNLFAGASVSGFTLQYGQRKMLGFSAFVDADSTRKVGLEGEARWLVFHQTAQVNATTWLAGPRYRRPVGKLQIYPRAWSGWANSISLITMLTAATWSSRPAVESTSLCPIAFAFASSTPNINIGRSSPLAPCRRLALAPASACAFSDAGSGLLLG
jgi:hypothetical protein